MAKMNSPTVGPPGINRLKDFKAEGSLANIKCPTLATVGSGEGGETRGSSSAALAACRDRCLFSAEEGADMHCQVGNLSLSNAVVYSPRCSANSSAVHHHPEVVPHREELRERYPVVLPVRIELTTSPLPRGCSTTELRQRRAGGENAGHASAEKARRSLPQ